MFVGLNDGGASKVCIALFQDIEPDELLCGTGHVFSPFRLPTTSAAAKADIPAAMWTTIPPAKSIAPKPFSQPSGFQTQCAIGT